MDKEKVNQEVEKTEEQGEEKTPTQYRVERAERQTEERILKELGVKSIDEIKQELEEGRKSKENLDKVAKELETASRKERLKALLSKEQAFDPDVLIPFVDVDVLDSDEDFEKAINRLKEIKPNHFGVKEISGDKHIKGSTPAPKNPIKEAEARGDYQGALAQWLRGINKGG